MFTWQVPALTTEAKECNRRQHRWSVNKQGARQNADGPWQGNDADGQWQGNADYNNLAELEDQAE
eukprot:m.342192 g.342192  ORF g.342192 m.342192 type:complete len:65 (-) comp16121_c0_seq8:169-363(-)